MLTNAQLQTLKAAILAETDPALVALRSAGASGAMAEWYNLDAAPVVKAWRVAVESQDLFEATPITQFDGLTAGKRDAWNLMLANAPVDASRNKIRAAVTDIWQAAQATTILTAMTENASRAEVLFGGSNATDGGVTALRRDWTGELRNEDIILALGS
jgi:hypothetical protein